MPIFPSYDSKRNIEATTAEPLRQEAAESFKPIQQLAQTFQSISEDWIQANDVMQATEAKSKFESGRMNIEQQALNDPDFLNSKTYFDQLQKLKDDSLSGIDNQEIVNNLSPELDLKNNISVLKISSNFKTKQISYNKSVLDKGLKVSYRNIFSPFSTEQERKLEEDNVIGMLNSNIALGTITEEEKDKLLLDARINAAEYEAVVHPEAFLKNGDAFYGIPQDEYVKQKNTAMQVIERNKKQVEQIANDIQFKNESSLVLSLANNEESLLSVPMISDKINTGEISRKFGEAYIRALTSPKSIDPDKKLQDSGFLDYAREIFKTENDDQMRKSVNNLLDGNSEGKINQEQMALLIQVASKTENKNAIVGFFDSVKKIAEKRLYFSAERVAFDYLSNLLNGKNEEESRKESVKNENIRTVPERSQYIVGDVINIRGRTAEIISFDEETGKPNLRMAK
jgi:hypothetical protein